MLLFLENAVSTYILSLILNAAVSSALLVVII
jgi:hypothetical protein